MKLICCCLSQVINNLFHLITTLRCSNIDQDSQPNTHTHSLTHPPNTPNTPTKEKRKEENRERGKRGKGTRTTPHPAPQNIHLQPKLIPRTTPTPHTKGKREEGKGKGGPFVCGVDTMCGTSVGCKRICCGAGVMWCGAGEEKRERIEGERGGRRKKGRKDYIKKMEKGWVFI